MSRTRSHMGQNLLSKEDVGRLRKIATQKIQDSREKGQAPWPARTNA